MAIGGWTSSKSKDGGVEIVDTSVSVVVDPNHNKQWEGVAAKRGGSLVASILWPYTTGETGSPAVGVSGKGGEGDLQVLVLVARGPSVREEMHQQIVRLLDGSAQETPKRKPSFYEMAKQISPVTYDLDGSPEFGLNDKRTAHIRTFSNPLHLHAPASPSAHLLRRSGHSRSSSNLEVERHRVQSCNHVGRREQIAPENSFLFL